MFKLKPALLLALLFLSSLYSLTASEPRFREASEFYNSHSCPSVRFATKYNHGNGHDMPSDASDIMCLKLDEAVNVAMTLDASYLRGSMAAIHSVLRHSSCPQNIAFHFIASNAAASTLPSLLASMVSASFPYLKFRIYPFNESIVKGLISASMRPSLDSPLNYARTYLSTLLPQCIHKVVYLDSDTILVDDIATLAATPLMDGDNCLALAAPEYCNADFMSYFTRAFWASPVLSLTFSDRKRAPCYFNTGVMVMDLDQWRQRDYTEQIEKWMEVQKKIKIYELGSLPPFLLVFGGRIRPVDHRWNQHGLGGDNYRGQCRDLHPGKVSLLHWSGKGKPWIRLDENRACPLDTLWASYDLLQSPSEPLDS